MAQEDYEQLENDQLLVQAMMGSRFLRTFERAVNEWNSSLSVVGDVVQALVVVRWKIQNLKFVHVIVDNNSCVTIL